MSNAKVEYHQVGHAIISEIDFKSRKLYKKGIVIALTKVAELLKSF